MSGGPTKHLPIAIGFGLEPGSSSSGGRAEAVTVDPGTAARVAESSKPEPKETPPQYVPVPDAAPVPEQPAAVAPAAPVEYERAGEEDIDALHARFDAMEASIKKRLAVATLHARFDALEAWLKARFGE